MKTTRSITYAITLAALLVGLQCSSPVSNNGSGSTTETANVKGFLYTSDGTTPAKGAKVYLVPADHNPRQGLAKVLAAAPESTVTNDSGIYRLDSVPAGTYNVLAAGSGNLAYQDSIGVKTDTLTQVPADTLKAPGGLRGLIRLQPGDDARTVFMLFMGTNTWAAPDDSTGTFGVANMAEGTYRVRLLTTLDAYVPKDTVLSVTAGKVDSLTHDIVLQYTGIPVVGGLKISYDTLKQIVTLSWNKPTTGRKIAGYNLYRKRSDSTSFVSIKSGMTDTVYRDSTGMQDQFYEYRVAVVDTNGTEGVKSAGKQIRIASYLTLDTTYNSVGNGTGQFDNPVDISIARNEDIYIADNNNNRIQIFDSSMHYKKQIGNGILNNPDKVTTDSLGHTFVARNDTVFVFDSAGVLADTIVAAGLVRDFDARGSELFVISNGDSIFVYSYDGTKKRAWKCGVANSSNYVVVGDSGEIIVNNDDLKKVMIYDSLGNNLSAISTTAYMYGLAFDLLKHRLFTVYLNNSNDSYVLHVTDKNNVEIANYRIPTSQPGEGVAIGLQQNGTVFLLFGTSNKILKLKSLLP